MKILLSFLLIFALAAPNISVAQGFDLGKLHRQIEILQREVEVLVSLLKNMQVTQPVQARGYIVVDLENGSTLLQKNASQQYPIASVTKLMTAVVTTENVNPTSTVTLTESMLRPLGRSPVFLAGVSVSTENLLKAMLIQSSNDAAQALASAQNSQQFVSQMNQKAQELGMANTQFVDAHGLSPSNRSTASDLVKLVTYINSNHPELLGITKENDFWFPDPQGNLLKFQNVNNFYPLSTFLGGKTGYLVEAKQTLASIFTTGDKKVVLIILGSPNRQADVFTLLNQLN